MRVLCLSMQSLHPGTAPAAHLGNLTRELTEVGETCAVLCPDLPREASLPRRALAWLWTSLRAVAGIPRADVLYVRLHPATVLVAAAARAARTPIVQEVNGPNEDFYETWPVSVRFRWLLDYVIAVQLRQADAIAAVTTGLAEWAARQAPGVAVKVIPNGVDPQRFKPGRARPGWLHRPYATLVATLTPWQGLDTAIAAAEHPEWPDGVELVIVGGGAGGPQVEAAERATPGRVRAAGARPVDEVVSILGNAQAALVLSRDRRRTGVSPLKLFEAMACGCPVIVEDTADMGDVVRGEGCGLIVPSAEPKAVAQAVRELVDDAALSRRLGEAGRTAATDRHAWRCRAMETAKLLHSVT